MSHADTLKLFISAGYPDILFIPTHVVSLQRTPFGGIAGGMERKNEQTDRQKKSNPSQHPAAIRMATTST